MVLEVDVRAFAAAHAEGAFVIDVREPYEYVSGHVPGAVMAPLNSIPHAAHQLPADRTIYVICASGSRSLAAAAWLSQMGLEARSVAGGTAAWVGAGHPVALGRDESAA